MERLNEKFLNAANEGNNELIKELLSKGVDVNYKNDLGQSAIYVAALSKKSDINTIKILLENGADINTKTIEKNTPLMAATTNNNVDIVDFLLKNGADVNAINSDGRTALINTKNSNIIQLLLDHGADPNIQDENGVTALMITAGKSHEENNIQGVKLLLDHGADPNLLQQGGWSALMFAIRKSNSTSNLETVKLLLDYGANPFVNIDCPTKACKKLIAPYIWKRLYSRDINLSKKYAQQTEQQQTQIPKDVWLLILLQKRREQLCRNLDSQKNKEVLILFALEFDIPISEEMTKGQICGLISRYLVYGKGPKPLDKEKRDLEELTDKVREVAYKFGLDPTESPEILLAKLSKILKF